MMRKCLLRCIALTLCFAVLFSISVCAGSISIDGSIQPEEWAGAPFATLFTSEKESGCAVSYADMRVMADGPSKRVYVALQVIDEAFTGAGALSRVHIGYDSAVFSFSADGAFQTSEGGHTVQAAGSYQSGQLNRDYVLEAVIISPKPLRGGKLPVSVWFTDGAGARSAVCELTVDTGLPAETEPAATTAPDTTHSATAPKPSASESVSSAGPTRPGDPHTTAAQSTGANKTTAYESRTQRVTRDPAGRYPQADKPHQGPAGGAAGGSPAGKPGRGSAEGEPSGLTPVEEVAIPATGDTGAGQWSAKRIVACALAGGCVLAAALLFVLQARKKEKQPEPKE